MNLRAFAQREQATTNLQPLLCHSIHGAPFVNVLNLRVILFSDLKNLRLSPSWHSSHSFHSSLHPRCVTAWVCVLEVSLGQSITFAIHFIDNMFLFSLCLGLAGLTSTFSAGTPVGPRSCAPILHVCCRHPHLALSHRPQTCCPSTPRASQVPGFGCLSRRDNAKALAALEAKMLLHLRSQAAFTRFWRSKARARRNCAVSSDNLPPISAARTTKRALPFSPESSG